MMHQCLDNLDAWQKYPMLMLSTVEDAFNMPLASSAMMTSLTATPDSNQEREMLQAILHALLCGAMEVLRKQLGRYLTGDLANPTSHTLELSSSAPLHNIFAEQALGMVDHQARRAPNATWGFIDGKVKFAKNHTISWLDSKTPEEQERIVDFVVKRGRRMRALFKEREEAWWKDCVRKAKGEVREVR